MNQFYLLVTGINLKLEDVIDHYFPENRIYLPNKFNAEIHIANQDEFLLNFFSD